MAGREPPSQPLCILLNSTKVGRLALKPPGIRRMPVRQDNHTVHFIVMPYGITGGLRASRPTCEE